MPDTKMHHIFYNAILMLCTYYGQFTEIFLKIYYLATNE